MDRRGHEKESSDAGAYGDMFQVESAGRHGGGAGFIGVDRLGTVVLDGAEVAAAGADITQDHESARNIPPCLGNSRSRRPYVVRPLRAGVPYCPLCCRMGPGSSTSQAA
jgi:hypothetical protein